MKTIINRGYEKFIATCDKCNCTFEYNLEDVRSSGLGVYFVDCPVCGYASDHFVNIQHMRKVDTLVDSFHKGE